MPNNETQTEEKSNGGKRFVMKTLGKSFKFLLIIMVSISLVLILLISFLKIIFKDETADKSAQINEFFNREKYIEHKVC